MKSILFVNFLEDKYSEDVAIAAEEKLKYKNYQFKYASHECVLNGRDGVKINNLYRPETIEFNRSIKFNTLKNSFLLEEARLMFLRSIDRVFLQKQSVSYLEWYFDRLVDFWVDYLNSNKVNIIIFDATPHFPWDIPLFYIGKLLGLKMVVIRRTFYSDAVTFCDDFRSSHTNFFKIPEEFRYDIKRSNKVSLVEKWAAKIIKESLRNSGKSIASISCIYKSLLYIIKYKFLSINYFKLSYVSLVINLVRRRYQALEALKYYRLNSRSIGVNLNYVLFTLHFRPERSTVPEGGGYSGQLQAIKKLREALPSDIWLVLKEHPRQLGDCPPDLRRLHQKEILLYKELLKIPNTILAPLECDQNKLILNSLMTASISGSVVWEGLLLGRPGITFANTWHSECQSSPDVANDECLNKTIVSLIEKSREEVQSDVSYFLEVISESVAVGARSQNLSSNSEIYSRNELVEKLSGALVGTINSLS